MISTGDIKEKKYKITKGRDKLVLVALSERWTRSYIPIFHHSFFQGKQFATEIVKMAQEMKDTFFLIRPRSKDQFAFSLLKDQKRSDRLIIFATHNRFFGNKADCLLEILDGNIKSFYG